jgi:DNA-binding CsgD family transcriptional regulator
MAFARGTIASGAAPAADDGRSAEPGVLTPRELEVLLLVARGMSNRRIARRLGISEKTVKNHLSAVYAKLGATCRTEATIHAIRLGIADPHRDSPVDGGKDHRELGDRVHEGAVTASEPFGGTREG